MTDTRRRWLLRRLDRYEPFDQTEASMLLKLSTFAMAHENCCDRRLPSGHITASAWIIDPTRRQVLLVHHAKLDRWLQPGGHIEGDPSIIDAARREVAEETGLKKFRLLSGEIFDVDVHPIPARRRDPEHLHYDVRFVFEASPGTALEVSEESHEVRWFALDEVAKVNDTPSLLRMVAKTKALGLHPQTRAPRRQLDER